MIKSYFTLNTLIFCITAICSSSCNTTNQKLNKNHTLVNVFDSLDYDIAFAYDYDGEGGDDIIDAKGRLANRIYKSAELTSTQVKRITDIFCSKQTYDKHASVAACFDPHFGVVLYKADTVVAFVSVCLDCNYLHSSIEISEATAFSQLGTRNIIEFEKNIGF